ncbi:hypothetical protein LB504_007123 [Fusarium proliferatum]|nr:hypothetical protein LB504_007123 [Fusarium proliferatum]
MPLRLGHTKSRHGCARCKQRRVKHPTSISDRPALFSLFVTETSLSIQPHETTCGEDLFLMAHFISSTARSISPRNDIFQLWQTVVPEDTITCSFLRHGMLALSAMHLASLRPLKQEYYKQYYQQHLNKAIPDYRRAIQNLKLEESGQVFAMATLVIIFALATVSDNALGNGDTLEGTGSSVADIVSIFTTVKGVTTLMADDTPIRRGVINSPYAVCTAGYEIPEAQTAEMPITVQLRYQNLRTSCLNTLLPGKESEMEACRNALDLLYKTHQELFFTMSSQDYDLKIDIDPSYLVKWIARVSAEFITMLRQNNTAALIIVGEFFTLMALLDGTWFAKNISVNALNAIKKVIKPQGLCWLRTVYPKDRETILGCGKAREAIS